jgi:hypothetical protein
MKQGAMMQENGKILTVEARFPNVKLEKYYTSTEEEEMKCW